MRRTRCFRLASLLTLAVFASSCLTTQLPPISTAGAGFEPLPDELALWQQARDEEEKLLEKVKLYDDPLLVDYLDGIVADLNPPGMAANRQLAYRVRVVEDPTLNAFAYPHGALYVHTGLLARMENEDQLATVFGHEMTHVERRHMVRYHRSAMNKQIGLTLVAIGAAAVLAGEEAEAYSRGQWGKGATIGVLADVMIGLGLQLAFLAAVNGYGRDLEYEADEGGFAKMAAAGYDTGEAPKVYAALLADHGEPRKVEAFFFGSHPQLTQRIANAKQLAAKRAATGAAAGEEPAGDPEEFAQRLRPVVRDDAGLNLEMGRLQIAEHQLAKARAWLPEDPETHLLWARLRLAQAEGEKDPAAQRALREEARGALGEAVRLDPARPAPHRELGLMAFRDGDRRTACHELRRYVALATTADDTARIRDYLLELERGGECPGERG
jgi:predicted Zn-dependent protease